MNYKKLYEKQYGERKLKSNELYHFFGFRKLLYKYDLSRYDIAKRLAVPGKRVLDIGCGEGRLLRMLKSKFDEFFGVDVAPSRIKEAQEKSPHFNLIEADADKKLPFDSGFFDTITCIATIEHIYDIFGLIKEIYRLLKPGG